MISTDKNVSNGIIHIIDDLLLPANLRTVYQVCLYSYGTVYQVCSI